MILVPACSIAVGLECHRGGLQDSALTCFEGKLEVAACGQTVFNQPNLSTIERSASKTLHVGLRAAAFGNSTPRSRKQIPLTQMRETPLRRNEGEAGLA